MFLFLRAEFVEFSSQWTIDLCLHLASHALLQLVLMFITTVRPISIETNAHVFVSSSQIFFVFSLGFDRRYVILGYYDEITRPAALALESVSIDLSTFSTVPPTKTECGCPNGGGINNGHVRYPSYGGTQKKKGEKSTLQFLVTAEAP